MTNKKKHIPNPKGRGKNRFVTTGKKEPTVVIRVKKANVEAHKKVDES